MKIADFGLSREFDAGKDYYLMRQGARLPMKWTDPSGVLDKRFGEFTDMWSFGVTLWELFTNASVPYDGVPNTEIQKRLNNGLRLSQPEVSSCLTNSILCVLVLEVVCTRYLGVSLSGALSILFNTL